MKSRKPKKLSETNETLKKQSKEAKVKKSSSESWLDASINPAPSSKARKCTEEGYPIYELSELVPITGGGMCMLNDSAW